MRKRSQRGQSMVEAAMVIPLLLLLLLGGYDASQFVSSKVVAVTAVRHGARLAAELGGTGTTVSPPTPQHCQGVQASGTTQISIDKQIVATVLSAAKTMNLNPAATNRPTQIDEIDVYLPSNADGRYTSGDPIDKFKADGSAITGSQSATLDLRCSGPLGFETSIGVRMIWHFFPPDGIPTKAIPIVPSGQSPDASNGMIDYAVEKANLCSDNCVN